MTLGRSARLKFLQVLAHRRELRSQLLALALLPVVIFALVWGSYVIRQHANDLQEQLQQRAQLLARQMAVAADYGIFSNNIASLHNLTLAVSKETAVVAATIYNANQQVLSDSSTVQPMAEPSRALIQSLVARSIQRANRSVSHDSANRFIYLEPIRSPALTIDDLSEPSRSPEQLPISGYAVVAVSSEAISAQAVRFAITVFALLTGVLVVSGVVVHKFSTRIDQRVQAVARAAQKIGRGEAGIRLGRSNITVFDRLSRDINRMSEQLEQSRNQLELRIEQATQAMRQQRDAAERANSAKTRFLAAASHDLRQPMHALNLLLAALKHPQPDQQRQELLQRVDATSQAMSGLLDALLDISRLDAGGVQPKIENFELLPLLLNLRDTYEGVALSKDIEFHMRPSRLWVQSDGMLVRRILSNFISNAIRYTPKGGRVLLAVRRHQQHALIQVRDNGPGIDAPYQQAIFEEFVQIHNPQRDRSLGLGLGLAIVQRLAQLLNHRIVLRSCLGQGAIFAIELPLVEPPAQAIPALNSLLAGAVGSDNTSAASTLAGYRILLIEDDTLVRESYELLLKLWGCQVSSHASAADAMAQLRLHSQPPQLIVTDYRLGGGINGLELIRSARQLLLEATPAILITGNTEEPELRQLHEYSLSVLFKPVKPAVLMQTLQHRLSAA